MGTFRYIGISDSDSEDGGTSLYSPPTSSTSSTSSLSPLTFRMSSSPVTIATAWKARKPSHLVLDLEDKSSATVTSAELSPLSAMSLPSPHVWGPKKTVESADSAIPAPSPASARVVESVPHADQVTDPAAGVIDAINRLLLTKYESLALHTRRRDALRDVFESVSKEWVEVIRDLLARSWDTEAGIKQLEGILAVNDMPAEYKARVESLLAVHRETKAEMVKMVDEARKKLDGLDMTSLKQAEVKVELLQNSIACLEKDREYAYLKRVLGNGNR